MSRPAGIIAEIVSQHAEEAAFLWVLRHRAVRAPHYMLNDLAKLDGRVEAHLDGLRIAGDEGWAICEAELLAHQEAGEVFAAGVLALESEDDTRIATVVNIGTTSPELARGLASAFGWLPYERVVNRIKVLLEADPPAMRRVGIAASALHRRSIGPVLLESLTDPDPSLRARAFRAIGELGTVGLVPQLMRGLADEDPDCRFWASWSCALLGETKAVPALQRIAERRGRYQEDAAKMALRRMEPAAAKGWQRDLAGNPELERLAVIGAGVMGDPDSVPWLIQKMETPVLARTAGESFSIITGIDLIMKNLEGQKPEAFEVGPNDNPEDENVEVDSDLDLPWPDASLVDKWWQTHRQRFKPGIRYFLGHPITRECLELALVESRQSKRVAAAVELVVLEPRRPLIEVRAAGFRQRHWFVAKLPP